MLFLCLSRDPITCACVFKEPVFCVFMWPYDFCVISAILRVMYWLLVCSVVVLPKPFRELGV